jgi:putative DNA primase/helicase
VRGEGGYVVLPPSYHAESGRFYAWVDADTPIAPLPGVLKLLLTRRHEPAERPPPPRVEHSSDTIRWARAAFDDEIRAVSQARENYRNNTLFQAACNLAEIVAGGYLDRAHVEKALTDAALSTGLELREIRASIASGFSRGLQHPRHPKSEPRPVRPRAPLEAPRIDPETGEVLGEEEHEARPPEFSDDALALEFTRRHGDDWRYVAAWGKWMIWRGDRWAFDESLQAWETARVVCRTASETAREMDKKRLASALASAKTVAAVEKLARSDRVHAAVTEQWDADPWLLATPQGTVDLRSGDTRPARRSDYLTKRTTVAPSGECPQWLDFLEKITDGDGELMDFMQRMAGYALTGITREHALFFLYGTGSNGKGTFLNALTGILGDYAAVASIDTFIATPTEKHSTDLAMLRGARLVTAQETEEGRRWAEAKLKALTGGDPITARFMRQDNFTYLPQFKLAIAGNHRPGLRNIDPAIRRRFHLIPFMRTFAADEIDRELPEKLRAEWPGILAWMIEGCQHWQKIGLKPPACVQAATEEYFDAEDAIQRWIDDCCMVRETQEDTSAVLYKSWAEWCAANGEYAGTQIGFSRKLTSKGFVAKPIGHEKKRGFSGLCVIRTQPNRRVDGDDS